MLLKILSGHVIHQKNPEVTPKKRDKFESIAEEKSIFLERLRDSRSWAYTVLANLNQADSYPWHIVNTWVSSIRFCFFEFLKKNSWLRPCGRPSDLGL